MINLRTGELEFFGMQISSKTKIDYFDGCHPNLIGIFNRDGENGIVQIKKAVVNNGIEAYIDVIFDEIQGVGVQINPKCDVLSTVSSGLSPAEPMKKWLHGMVSDGEYEENEEGFTGDYDWGWLRGSRALSISWNP